MEVHLARIDLVVVGSLPADLARVAADYERRLTRYVRLAVHEVKGEPLQRGPAASARAEGERLLATIERLAPRGGGATVVTCDSTGEQPTSEAFASRIMPMRHLVLVVGGATGFTDEVRSRAGWSVSFGRVTLPHAIARVVATEQLYRAFRIARGEPYHY